MSDISNLPLLDSAEEQYDDVIATPGEVETLARPAMNAQFADAIAKASHFPLLPAASLLMSQSMIVTAMKGLHGGWPCATPWNTRCNASNCI